MRRKDYLRVAQDSDKVFMLNKYMKEVNLPSCHQKNDEKLKKVSRRNVLLKDPSLPYLFSGVKVLSTLSPEAKISKKDVIIEKVEADSSQNFSFMKVRPIQMSLKGNKFTQTQRSLARKSSQMSRIEEEVSSKNKFIVREKTNMKIRKCQSMEMNRQDKVIEKVEFRRVFRVKHKLSSDKSPEKEELSLLQMSKKLAQRCRQIEESKQKTTSLGFEQILNQWMHQN